jgi:hypothetical protein
LPPTQSTEAEKEGRRRRRGGERGGAGVGILFSFFLSVRNPVRGLGFGFLLPREHRECIHPSSFPRPPPSSASQVPSAAGLGWLLGTSGLLMLGQAAREHQPIFCCRREARQEPGARWGGWVVVRVPALFGGPADLHSPLACSQKPNAWTRKPADPHHFWSAVKGSWGLGVRAKKRSSQPAKLGNSAPEIAHWLQASTDDIPDDDGGQREKHRFASFCMSNPAGSLRAC